MAHDLTFDAGSHTYRVDGKLVPGVTGILADLAPGWQASEWHLNRGQEVHACAALVANRQQFQNDPQIDGYVAAIRKFFAEQNPTPLMVERKVFSTLYRYAGTLDMLLVFKGKLTVLDYKNTLTATVPYQCAAYAICLEREKTNATHGVGVELHEDGTYRISQHYDLKAYKREWLGLLSAYNTRRKLNIEATKEE